MVCTTGAERQSCGWQRRPVTTEMAYGSILSLWDIQSGQKAKQLSKGGGEGGFVGSGFSFVDAEMFWSLVLRMGVL